MFLRRCLLMVALLVPLATAQAQGARDSVDWSVSIYPVRVAPGGTFSADVAVKIRPGWKMYAMDSPAGRPVDISFADSDYFVPAGEVIQAPPEEGYDPNFDATVTYFSAYAEFRAPFRVLETLEEGRYPLEGQVVFMICNDRMCLPPTPVPISTEVIVAADAATQGAAEPAEGAREGPVAVPENRIAGTDAAVAAGAGGAVARADDFASAGSGGWWAFILLAAGAGLAALLTPCVFPMIPLTISYFTRHAENRSESLRMALVYGLAIVVTFTSLGVLTALLVGAAGAQTIAANPWINLFIGLVFIFFAFSLLGLFELRLPTGLLNYFDRQSSQRGGYVGVLFMGLTLTLVSFSCTAPFVGGLLAATVQGQWAYPVVGMLVFSATFALPFFFFALFPKGLSALPRSGSWMNSVKVILGFVELAAALKFLSNADLIWGWNVISRPLAIALVVVIFAMAGLYLLGKLRLSHEPPVEQVGVMRLMVAILFFGTSLYMLPGLFGAPLNAIDAYLPPRQGSDVSLLSVFSQNGGLLHSEFDWFDEIEPAFAEARQVGKPVFIDFTGYTCTNCREMEANVFPRQEVASRLRSDFVLLRLYTDDLDRGPEFQRYQLRTTGTVALPTYAIVDPSGEPVLAKVSGLTPTRAFAAFLENGMQRHVAAVLASSR